MLNLYHLDSVKMFSQLIRSKLSRAVGNLHRSQQPLLKRIPLPVTYPTGNFSSSVNSTTTSNQKRVSLGLRRQKLPPYPKIETIEALELKTFLPTNFKLVKHGDYEFKECLEGYVHVYATGYRYPRNPRSLAAYAAYYGQNHPLNTYGVIEGRQDVTHSKLYAVLQALKSIPENQFSKICICVDELWVIPFLSQHLMEMSENAFRSVYTGKLSSDLETNMALNTVLRTRTDLKFRVKYVPLKIGFADMIFARQLATKASKDAEHQRMLRNKFNVD